MPSETSSDLLKVLFVSTQNAPVTYYRMYAFAKSMHEQGLAKCKLFPTFQHDQWASPDWESNFFKQSIGKPDSPLIEATVWADIVVVQFVSTPEGLSYVEAVKDMKPCFM